MKAIEVILIGYGATLFMDLYSFTLKKYFGIHSLDYRLIGRWLIYLSKAKLIHCTIVQTPKVKHEKLLGWLSHYLMGILFSMVFVKYVYPSHYSPSFWHLYLDY